MVNSQRRLVAAAFFGLAITSLACTRTVTVSVPTPTTTSTVDWEALADEKARAACITHTEVDVIGDKVSDASDKVAVGLAAAAARESIRWQVLYEALTRQAELARFLQAQPAEFFDKPGGNDEIGQLGRQRIVIENECKKFGGGQ